MISERMTIADKYVDYTLTRYYQLRHYHSALRHYHSAPHIRSMLEDLQTYRSRLTDIEYEILTWAIMFHDAIYDPRRKDNEEKSCEEFRNLCPDYEHAAEVCRLIMVTKHHEILGDKLADIIINLDLAIFEKGMTELLGYEQGIFKEYQFVTIKDYIPGRVRVLEKFKYRAPKNIEELIKYVQNRRYRIGIYPGSFNPFHVGHLDVLRKAEEMFDKVVVARGVNPDKGLPEHQMPWFPNEIVEYNGLVTELFENAPENVELFFVRGLRNVYDIGYEENLRKGIHDIKPDIRFVYFFCDPQYEHISSSQIRGLWKFDKKLAGKYIVEATV